MDNEKLLNLAEKYGIELAKEVLKNESGIHESMSENEAIAKMISDGTMAIIAEEMEKQKEQSKHF